MSQSEFGSPWEEDDPVKAEDADGLTAAVREIAREVVNEKLKKISDEFRQVYIHGRFERGSDADQVIDYLDGLFRWAAES